MSLRMKLKSLFMIFLTLPSFVVIACIFCKNSSAIETNWTPMFSSLSTTTNKESKQGLLRLRRLKYKSVLFSGDENFDLEKDWDMNSLSYDYLMSGAPIPSPTRQPNPRKTKKPAEKPTPRPTRQPNPRKTKKPTDKATLRPTKKDTPRSTRRPITRPTNKPTPRRTSLDPIATSRPTKEADSKDTPVIAKSLAFDIDVQPFSPNILSGYADCHTLEMDIEMALKFEANKIIDQQYDYACYYHNGPVASNPVSAPEAASPVSAPSSTEKETSFGTNNQVKGVEEADAIQSDGTHIFMAYGSDIVVIDLDGNLITKEEVPSPAFELTDDFIDDKISVSSLLLNKNRLLAFADKYDYSSEKKVFGSTTFAFVYEFDSSSDSPLTLVHEEKITGHYESARAVNEHAHVVTSIGFRTWDFTDSLYRCRNDAYEDMTNDEYVAAATKIASDTVSDYAAGIVLDLLGDKDGVLSSCQHIVQINSLTSGSTIGMELDMAENRRTFLNRQDLLDTYYQVTSFDFTTDSATLESTKKKAGAFLNWDVEIYASEYNLVLASNGWSYNEDSSYDDITILMGFVLNGAEAKPIAVGEVTGRLLNSYSIDWWNGHLRVATTSREKGFWETVEENGFVDYNYVVTAPSTSQVTVLEYNGKNMVMTGQVINLGVGESIFATRFLGDKAFVVTFRQVDPLYTLDLSDPKNPVQRGELKITGFSNYMKSVQDDYLLTVGQEADESTGRTTGLKISLFDVSDLDNPLEHDKYVEKSGTDSSAQYDFHAFRYLDQSKRLIIPVTHYRYWDDDAEQFDGFKVYNVDANNNISPSANVTHARDDNWNWCYSQARLPSRSMVFEGTLVTFKGHSVLKSDDLDTPEKVWDLNLDEGRNETQLQCHGWWRF